VIRVDRFIPAALRACPRRGPAARHLFVLAGVTALSAPLLALLYHYLGYAAAGTVVLGGALVMVAAPFTLNAGVKLAPARDLFIGALYALKIWLALHLGGLGAPTLGWFALCPMIALLVGGLRPGLAWAGIVLLTLMALFAHERSAGALQPHPVSDPLALQLAGVVGLVVLASVIVGLAVGAGKPRS